MTNNDNSEGLGYLFKISDLSSYNKHEISKFFVRACLCNNLEYTKIFVNNGAILSWKKYAGLNYAISNNNFDIVNYLFSLNIKIHHVKDETLMSLARNGYVEMFDLLIKRKRIISNILYKTLLKFSDKNGQFEMIEYLNNLKKK